MGNGEGTTTSSTNYHEQSQRQETIRKIGFKHTSQISIVLIIKAYLQSK